MTKSIKNKILKIYPNAVCIRYLDSFAIIDSVKDQNDTGWARYSSWVSSEKEAWESAYEELKSKMIEKLASDNGTVI